jgi:hypothetical protein
LKTPREILLARHRTVEPKLDAIRREAVKVAADVNRRKQPVRELTFAATLANAIRLSCLELIWPCRRIWAGLAAAWILIFTVNFSMRDPSPTVTQKSPPASEMIFAWQQQQRLMAELNGLPAPRDTEQQKIFRPRPRTEHAEILAV